MSDRFANQPFPRSALIGAATLVGVALLTAATARIGGIGVTRMPESVPVASRDLRFQDRLDGAVAVLDARAGDREVHVLAPGTNGFVRGVLRGLVRERKRRDIGAEAPFRLIRWADGRLSLDDPVTQRRIELGSFGPTNAEAFAQLMSAGRGAM